MSPREAFSVLVFLVVIAVIYWLELRLLVRSALARLLKKAEAPNLLSRPAIILHCISVAGLLCLAYGWLIEPYWLEITDLQIATEKLKAARLRIIHISDLHCDCKVRNEPKLPGIVNPLEPDIIVFTGDCLNSPEALPVFQDTLRKLDAGIGKFAVRGNFELHFPQLGDLFAGTGFRELDGESIIVKKGFISQKVTCIWGRKPA